MDNFAKIVGYLVILGILIFGLCWAFFFTVDYLEKRKIEEQWQYLEKIENAKKQTKEKQDYYNNLGVCSVLSVRHWKSIGNGPYCECELTFRTEDNAVLCLTVYVHPYDPYYLEKFKLTIEHLIYKPSVIPVEWKPERAKY